MNKLFSIHHDAYTFASFEIALSFPSIQESFEVLVRSSRIDQIMIKSKMPHELNTTYTWSTFPGKWLSRYNRRSYVLCDPVVKAGFSKRSPFFMQDIKVQDNEKRLLDDAARYGIGPNGFCVPLRKEGSIAVLAAFSQNMQKDDWKYYIKSIEPELIEFAKSIHTRSIDELKMEESYFLP